MQWLIPILALAAALIRTTRLPRSRYFWFIVYLTASILRGSVLWFASSQSRQFYFNVWFYTEPAIGILWITIALELYSNVSRLYTGMGRASWAALAMGIAILASWLTLIEQNSTQLQQVLLARRITATVLVVALALITGLFGYFRNNLPRNAIVHACVMMFYFMTQAVGFLRESLDPDSNWGVVVGSWGAIAAYALWALLLTRAGETRPLFRSARFTDEQLAAADDAAIDEITRMSRRAGRRDRENTDD